MKDELVNRREQAMDRADQALDAAWPDRKGTAYVRQMKTAIKALEQVAREMRTVGVELVEQSRAYRYIGSIYSDLAPALGKEMLAGAKEAYLKAEALLGQYPDSLERAKLNFNFANTLRQIDPSDISQLCEAKSRFLDAKQVFLLHAPEYLERVETALKSVDALLKIAPLFNAVERNLAEMRLLEKELSSGQNLAETANKIHDVMTREGGPAALIGKTKILLDELPAEIKQSEQFTEMRQKIDGLTEGTLKESSMGPHEARILTLLQERLKSEINESRVKDDRAETLKGILNQVEKILSGKANDIHALVGKLQTLRDFADDQFNVLHYLSHGINRPPANSRAEELVELCWSLRRFLLEEMNRSGKGAEESKEVLDLNVRATRVDKRIYEAGGNDIKAKAVDKEELRPLALAVRRFSARAYPMLAKPIWPAARVPVNTDAIFYSGPFDLVLLVKEICIELGLELMPTPKSGSFANARWKQLQKSMTTIFDFRIDEGPARASVAYELGIALSLGKPIVVVAGSQALPFDVDIDPVVLKDASKDKTEMAQAISRSLVWTYPPPRSKSILKTLEYVFSRYSRDNLDTYASQLLSLLDSQTDEADPLTIERTIGKLVEFLKEKSTMLIHPVWAPAYPDPAGQRLFHVMPFRPAWADDAAFAVQKACEALGINYVRGDKVEDPNVIRSIWEEIACATHVLVDLTDFNANVALELGIAHTLGRPSLLVGQKDTVERLFPMISKLRVHAYRDPAHLNQVIQEFLR